MTNVILVVIIKSRPSWSVQDWHNISASWWDPPPLWGQWPPAWETQYSGQMSVPVQKFQPIPFSSFGGDASSTDSRLNIHHYRWENNNKKMHSIYYYYYYYFHFHQSRDLSDVITSQVVWCSRYGSRIGPYVYDVMLCGRIITVTVHSPAQLVSFRQKLFIVLLFMSCRECRLRDKMLACWSSHARPLTACRQLWVALRASSSTELWHFIGWLPQPLQSTTSPFIFRNTAK